MYSFCILYLCIQTLVLSSAIIIGSDNNNSMLSEYDYIIVGCGNSGLVVAMRLTEDPNINVLCIEAGEADSYQEQIMVPRFMIDSKNVHGYDWGISSVPQVQLDGKPRNIPQGRVLGGTTIINGMVWTRGYEDDYNAWEQLGADGWNWQSLSPYFRKSENFTVNLNQTAAEIFRIDSNKDIHGTDGPIHVSYANYIWKQSVNLFHALFDLNITTIFDVSTGSATGAAFASTSLHLENQTRSDARRGYYDSVAMRRNLHIQIRSHVTRVIIEGYSDPDPTEPFSYCNYTNSIGKQAQFFGFGIERKKAKSKYLNVSGRHEGETSDGLQITGVEFTSQAYSKRVIINGTREVILAAGALHSPQILMLSGIGPAKQLTQQNIRVAFDSPGVGQNLQDHAMIGNDIEYTSPAYLYPEDLTTNSTWDEECRAQYYSNRSGPWTAGSPNALVFPSLASITANASTILQRALTTNATLSLPLNFPPELVPSYFSQRTSLISRLNQIQTPAYEIIPDAAGQLTISIMHPLSRGTLTLASPDPFQSLLVDGRWLADSLDREIAYAALLFNRKLLTHPQMQLLQPIMHSPGPDDDEASIQRWIDESTRTGFHPCGTTAMGRREYGAVVDSRLKVWGTKNLRVVDAGVMPLVPAGHLMATVYAIAEKAADLIKEDNFQRIERV